MSLVSDVMDQAQNRALRQQYGKLAGQQPTSPTGITPPGTAPGSVPFGPAQNLIGTQFATGPSADTTAARGQLTSELGALQGPDRQALAGQTFQQLTDASAPQYQQDLRRVGEEAASLGRIGSGVTTSELGDVALQRQKYLGNLAAQLSTQSAGETLNDRLAALGGTEGGLGALTGLDQTTLANQQSERGYQAGESQQAFDNALSAAGFTAPSPLATQIGGQYGDLAQGAYSSSGALLQQILQQYGKKPYAGTGTFDEPFVNTYGAGDPNTYTGGYLPPGNRPPSYQGPR